MTLYERNAHPGGQWRIAERPAHKLDYRSLIPRLVRGLEKAGVRLVVDTEVTPGLVAGETPEVVVIATGAEPITAQLECPDTGGPSIVHAHDIVMYHRTVGDRVVVVGG